MIMNTISQVELKRLFNIDPITGIILWRIRPAACVPVGTVAGKTDNEGCRQIKFKGKQYYSHKLIWIWVYGDKNVPHRIGHLDHNRSNNCISNLCSTTPRKSGRNQVRQVRNTSGTTGVWFNKVTGKWEVNIVVAGNFRKLGAFTDKAEAIKVRQLAQINYGFHPNHGKLSTEV